jgi:hypothetical protein
MSKLGSVRRSQLITTYGVGSIIPVDDQSVMVAGLDQWPVGLPDVFEPRLESLLAVRGFVRPPASESEKARDIPVVRFPTVYSCPVCERLDFINYLASTSSNECLKCGVSLVPSRFIIVCQTGHIDEFPYFEWVHQDTEFAKEIEHQLTIGSSGVSASLSDVVVKCSCGVRPRTMAGSFSKGALRGVKRCNGRRPWIGDHEHCDEMPRTLQRGASNVYFPIVQSALSIPPWSEGAHKIIQNHWVVFQHLEGVALKGVIDGMGLARGTAYTSDSLVKAVIQRKEGVSSGSLRVEEYEALCNGQKEHSREQEFVCVLAAGAETVSDIFDLTMAATKLREVRALTGFTRLQPPAPGEEPSRIAKLSLDPMGWFPAIEVKGEGVFFRFPEERLRSWESKPEVRDRAAKVDFNYRRRFAAQKRVPDRTVTPRLLLVHTMAHALINQWSLDCGYPASSLRERLFVSSPQDRESFAGLLIYTATTDAAGSLGGVVGRADKNKLRASLVGALQRVAWCSADPLCVEADAAGVDSLNLAACHACVLLPETSCEEQNVLLDRAMLVGTPMDPSFGYFRDIIDMAEA